MTDPYNTYIDHVQPARPVTTAATPAVRAVDPIARLDVSDGWKRKFRLIEKAGGADLPNLRELPFGERRAIGFNFLAFFFGPFYYLAKGLWRPALMYFFLALALSVVLGLAGMGGLARAVGYGLAALYGMRANVACYRKVVLGEARWF